MTEPAAAREFLTREQTDGWRRIQESFARVTGLAFWTIDPDGTIIGPPSNPSSICLQLRKKAESRALCNRDCIASCQKALRANSLVYFRCHADLQCFAAPLRSGSRPVGVILGGQVLTGPPPLDRYRTLALECGLPEDELMKAVGQLTIGTEKGLRQAAEFVTDMAEVVFSGWASQDTAARKINLLSNLFTLSAELSPEMDIRHVQALALNSLSILFNIESAALLVENPADGRMTVQYALGPGNEEIMGIRLSREDSLLRKFHDDGQPLITDDYYLLLKAGFPEFVRQAGLFPLFTGESLKGILAVFNRPLSPEEGKLVAYFGNQASMTMHNVRLREELRRQITSLSILTRFSEKLSHTLEMDQLLSIIFEEVSNQARAERSSLMILNEKTRELMVKLARGGQEGVPRNFTVPLSQGLAGQVVRAGEPLLVKDLETDDRFHRRSQSRYRTPSCVILPLKISGRTIGVLNFADKITGEVYNEEDLNMLLPLANQAAVALERSELYELSKELKQISITDSLTNLLNRRYFQERATEEVERSRRFNQPLSLIMLDVDDFKHYNDSNGHPAGDAVLKGIGSIIKSVVRSIDVVARYGGEEFAVLSPGTDRDRCFHVAERVRRAAAEHEFTGEKGQPGGDLTISAGVATFPDDATNLEELISDADKALYLSKKNGKNRSSTYRRED